MIINKSIRQNWKIFNMIGFEIIDFEVPEQKESDWETEGSQRWSEKTWNYIVENKLDRLAYYSKKSKDLKYNITVWLDEKYVYLIQVVRTEFNTDNTRVIMATNTEDNVNDLKNIAKFLHKNISGFIKESVGNVQQFHQLQFVQEELKPDGDA